MGGLRLVWSDPGFCESIQRCRPTMNGAGPRRLETGEDGRRPQVSGAGRNGESTNFQATFFIAIQGGDRSDVGIKKQPKKLRKQLRKDAGKARAIKKKSKRRIAILKAEKRLLELRVTRLQRRLDELAEGRRGPETTDEQPGKEVVSNHRIAWERYSYLHDRYDAYIEKGTEKEDARNRANRDLMKRFGRKAGYTEQQLACIFL